MIGAARRERQTHVRPAGGAEVALRPQWGFVLQKTGHDDTHGYAASVGRNGCPPNPSYRWLIKVPASSGASAQRRVCLLGGLEQLDQEHGQL